MIDIHSHILPGLDDGPNDLSEAVKIAGAAYDQGITTLFATPHSMNGVFQSTPQEIISKCDVLNKALEKNNIPIRIMPGSEICLTHDTISLYENGQLMTLNNKGEYILLELPPMFIIDGVIRIIKQLAERGIKTIIAHPERNVSIMKNLNIISKLIYEGALMQITATSLMGGFGRKSMKICKHMLDNDAVTFVGSDIHPGRTFMMREAYKKTKKIAGEQAAEKIFMENPEEILFPMTRGIRYSK